MGIRETSVDLGVRAAKQLAGDPATASAALGAARSAHQLISTARKAGSALLQATGKDALVTNDRPDAEPATPKTLDETTAIADAGKPALKAALEGISAACAGFKQGKGTAVQPTEGAQQVFDSVGRTVKGTSLIVADQARALATVAENAAPRPVAIGARLLAKRASAEDVGAAIAFAADTHGGLLGFGKRKIFEIALSRTKGDDPAVFTLLEHFSNDCPERMRALGSILRKKAGVTVNAATAEVVLDGFNTAGKKPDMSYRLDAISKIAPRFESPSAAAEVIQKLSDDESVRFDALKRVAEHYKKLTAAEIVGFLVIFNKQRSKAKAQLINKLSDPENVGEIDKLFFVQPKITESAEYQRLAEAGRSLFGNATRVGRGFLDGLRKATQTPNDGK